MNKKSLFIIILLLVALSVQAQTIYSLDSCKAMALHNNLTIQNKRLSIDAAQQVKKEAFTKYFPSISAIGIGFKTNRPMIDTDFDLGELQISYFSPVLLSIPLPTLPIQALSGGISGSVTAVQPLFAGLRIVHGNQLAKIGIQAADLQVKMSENEVIEKVETYYWQIVALKEKLKTIETFQRQLTRIAIDVDAAVAAGVVNRNDKLTVQLKQQELAGGKLKVENGIRVCKMILRQYAQIPEQDFDIEQDSITMPEEPTSYYVESQYAVNQRVEKQLLDLNVKAAELQTKMEMGKYLPQVAVGAAYSAYMMEMNKDNTPTNNFGMVFGSVSIPISDWWGGGHAIKKCKINEQIAINERDNNLQLMTVQIEQTWNEWQEAYQQLLISQQSIALSQENLKIQQDYYQAGTSTLSDLLNAQSMLQQSMDDFTNAYVNYQVKKRIYLQVIGK
jgi:outer membrane protein